MSFGSTPDASIRRRLRSTAIPPSFPSPSRRSQGSRLSFPTDKEERNMAKLHLVPCFDCKRGDVFGLVLRYEVRDALDDLAALFVEGVFPKQAGEHGAPQFEPGIDLLRDCPFISLGMSFCANSTREQALPY